MNEIEFHQVKSQQHKALAGALIGEYLDYLNVKIQHDYGLKFDVEAMVNSDLSDETKFSPPNGRFYLVNFNSQTAGVGCLKKLHNETGEIQRMYVSPDFRGHGLGRAIVNRLVDDARLIGYRKLKLESLNFLNVAHELYRSIGFCEINAYAKNSMSLFQAQEQLDQYYTITTFMEMDL